MLLWALGPREDLLTTLSETITEQHLWFQVEDTPSFLEVFLCLECYLIA